MCTNPINLKVPNYNATDIHNTLYSIGTNDYIVPCGKCKECLQEKSREWSFRIMDEASLYVYNSFVTLTYNDDYLPPNESVVKRDIQLFLKRLRKQLAKEDIYIRYFCCGEYGDLKGRPHYHMIIFGWLPTDLEFLKVTKRGEDIYRSKFLEKIWPFGYVSVGDLTLQSAKYTALYMQKLVKRKPGQDPPFQLMSKSPGIGAGAFNPKMVETDKVYHAGNYVKLPRYYLTLAERQGIDLTHLKSVRAKKRQLFHKTINELKKNQAEERNFVFDKVVVV